MRTLIVLLILSLAGCGNEDDSPLETYDHCFPMVEKMVSLDDCESFSPTPESFLCDIEELGSFQLSDRSKSYMSLFCRNIGDVLEYFNDEGETIKFTILTRRYNEECTWRNTFKKCNSDSLSSLFVYFINENAETKIMSDDLNLELMIKSEVVLDSDNPSSGKFGEVIDILEKTDGNNYARIFRAISNERTLDNSLLDQTEYYSEINLGGNEYFRVLSMNISNSNNNNYKFYIDQDNGIVSFQDYNGKLWTL